MESDDVAAAAPAVAPSPAESGEAPRPAGLEPFVRDGLLRSLPSKQGRRHTVLAHVVETSFAPATAYDEPAVNEILLRWCEGGEVDHVAIRRYLVDHRLLFRVRGVYARSLDVLPEPGPAEQYMGATGLS